MYLTRVPLSYMCGSSICFWYSLIELSEVGYTVENVSLAVIGVLMVGIYAAVFVRWAVRAITFIENIFRVLLGADSMPLPDDL